MIPLQQPPPDAPVPLPGKDALRSRRTMMGIVLLGCGSIVALLLFSGPLLFTSQKAPNRTEAINNIKQIDLALEEFETTCGRFPDESTVVKVKADSGTTLSLTGSSSNAMFRQLIAKGLKGEKIFYCKAKHIHRPDDVFFDDAHALAPGECGFAYVAGVLPGADPRTPVVMAPMIPGTKRFDLSIHDGKAVVLFRNGSANALTINPAGQVIINGMDLLDPRQPFWHGKAPDLRLPE